MFFKIRNSELVFWEISRTTSRTIHVPRELLSRTIHVPREIFSRTSSRTIHVPRESFSRTVHVLSRTIYMILVATRGCNL